MLPCVQQGFARAGAWFRGFRAPYFGGLVNIFIKAWLMFSALGIVAMLFGADPGAKENLEVWCIILALDRGGSGDRRALSTTAGAFQS